MHYVLRQIVPPNSGKPIEIPITEDEVQVGRLQLVTSTKFRRMSKRHAIFYKYNGSLFVKDLGSRNGLFVNDIKLGSSLKSLALGDIIGFGVRSKEIAKGFVCIVCTNIPATVNHEVIDLPNDDEVDSDLVQNSQVQEDNITSQLGNVPISKEISSETNDIDSTIAIVDRVQITPALLHNNSDELIKGISRKTCVISLAKCDSKEFKLPSDVRNPFVKEYNVPFNNKYKCIKKQSFISATEDYKGTVLLGSSFGGNQKTEFTNEYFLSNNAIAGNAKRAKRKVGCLSSSKRMFLCTNIPPGPVEHELIDISDDDEIDSDLVKNSQVLEDSRTSQLGNVPISKKISSENNDTENTITIVDKVQIAPALPHNNSDDNFKSSSIKKCAISLVKCDSKEFKLPSDVRNPFVKEYKVSLTNGKKHKCIRKRSFISDTEDYKGTVLSGSSFIANQKKKFTNENFPSSDGKAVNAKRAKRKVHRLSSSKRMFLCATVKHEAIQWQNAKMADSFEPPNQEIDDRLVSAESVEAFISNIEQKEKELKSDSNKTDDTPVNSSLISIKQSTALRKHDYQKSDIESCDSSILYENVGQKLRSNDSSDEAFNSQPSCSKKLYFADDNIEGKFSDSYLKSQTETSQRFQNKEEMSYSQVEEIIIISDEESYLNFRSPHSYVHNKKEPEEMDDPNEELCRQICRTDMVKFLSFATRVDSFEPLNQEIDDRVVFTEFKEALINNMEQKEKDMKYDSNNTDDVPVNDFFSVLTQDFDNDKDYKSESISAELPSVIAQNSSEIHLFEKEKEINEVNSSTEHNKGARKGKKTLLIDSKSMTYRSHRAKESDESFVKKNTTLDPEPSAKQLSPKLSDKQLDPKTFVSNKNIKANTFLNEWLSRKTGNKLSTFKMPLKSKAEVPANNSEKFEDVHTSTSLTDPNSSELSVKRARTIKTRQEKITSKMGLLVNYVPINSHRIINDVTKGEVDRSVSNNKKVPYPSLSEKKYDRNKYFPNKHGTQNKIVPVCISNESFNQNITIPVSVNKLVLSNIYNIGKLTFNPRDPRQNKFNASLPCNFSMLSSPSSYKSHVEVNSRVSSYQNSGNSLLGFRPNNTSSENLSFQLIKSLIQLNTNWLKDQGYMKIPPPSVSKGAADLPLSYESYDSYVSSMLPMLMLEIWEHMYAESIEIYASNKQNKKFYFSIVSHIVKDSYIELKCESVINEEITFGPREGNITILELKENPTNCSPKFGYIFKHKIQPLSLNSLSSSHWKKLSKEWLINAQHWTFYAYVKKKEMAFELNSLMKGNGICYIRNKLRLADALDDIKNSPLLRDIIIPRWESFLVKYSVSPPNRKYNAYQMEAINGISDEINKPRVTPKIILLQGPPGTGKTHTIIGIIEKLIYSNSNNPNFKILLSAPSNAAVDEIGCRLIEMNKQGTAVKFVRIGRAENVNAKMKPYFIDDTAEKAYEHSLDLMSIQKEKNHQTLFAEIRKSKRENSSKERNQKLKYCRGKYKPFKDQNLFGRMDHCIDLNYKRDILEESNIILSTLSSCGLSLLVKRFKKFSNFYFSCCIIDESTQCTELEILQPLVLGINKLILVGDHKQLPTTVLSKLACKYGFEKPAFERFHMYFKKYFKKTPIFTLSEQFRMHSAICEFPSKHFYDRQIVTHPNTDLRNKNFPLRPYILLDILSEKSIASSSKVNCIGAYVLVDICRVLLDIVDSPSSIGIITPYQAHISLYKDALYNNSRYKSIEVNTVDGFQGREKDIIILYSVRTCSQSGSIDFITNRQRLNVAITRARKCLIICTFTDSLMHHSPDWRALVIDAKERNVCIGVTSPKDIPILMKHYIKKQISDFNI